MLVEENMRHLTSRPSLIESSIPSSSGSVLNLAFLHTLAPYIVWRPACSPSTLTWSIRCKRIIHSNGRLVLRPSNARWRLATQRDWMCEVAIETLALGDVQG